jgi:NADPH oxidase 2
MSAVGCDEQIGAGGTAQSLDRTMPRVMIDGPFGSASEVWMHVREFLADNPNDALQDFLNFETVMLISTGIGVTPFAS